MRLVITLFSLCLFAGSVFASDDKTAAAAKQLSQSPEVTASFIKGDPLPSWAQPLTDIPEIKHKESVVARLLETQAMVKAPYTELMNKAIQVNDRKALGIIGQYSVEYYPAYQKLHLHRVAIIRGKEVFDRTASVDVRLLQNEPSLDEQSYIGVTTMQLLLEDVRVGDTLWITYSIEGINPVFDNHWSENITWDSPAPIDARRLIVIHPRNHPLNWRQLGDYRSEKIVPKISDAGDLQVLRFEQNNLDALPEETHVPENYLTRRVLQFSEFENWQGVAKWADGLFPKVGNTPALQALARQFSKEQGELAQASAALHWVQSEVRYFSVDLGENSHRPHSPDSVIEKRYGDCKDKSYLLVSLLQQLGIEAHPVLLSATSPELPAKLIATHDWFNHVIVQLKLGSTIYYVDPTRDDQAGPIDKLPPAFPGASVVIIGTGATSLLTLPETDDVAPWFEHQEKIKIAKFDGDATLEEREIYRGTYADWARSNYPGMSEESLRNDMLSDYEKMYPGITLLGVPAIKDFPDQGRFEVEAKFNLPKPVSIDGDYYGIEYDSLIMNGTLGIPDNLTRHYPFALPHGKFHGRYRIDIEWPAEIRANNNPHATNIDNPFFHLHEEYLTRGNLQSYLLDYHLKKEVVSAAELPQLHAQAKALNNFEEATLRVAKHSVKPKIDDALSIRHLEENLALEIFHNDQEIIADLPDRPDDIETSCRSVIKAQAVSDLLDNSSAALLKSVETSLRAKIGNAGARLCLARILFARGEFKESAKFYLAEKSLKDDASYNLDLAWARYYTGDEIGAQETLARYLTARKKSEARPLTDYDIAAELGLLQRMGKTASGEDLHFAQEVPDGPWPRPLLALQTGTISQEVLFDAVNSYPRDARDMALTEAWFYIGEQRLAMKDSAGAKKAFEWLMINGVRSSPFYMQAGSELRRMQPADANYDAGMHADAEEKNADALAQWRESAKNGNAAAEYQIGYAFYHGKGVKQDVVEAMQHFKLAAARGDAQAMNMMGSMSVLGQAVKEDQHAAVDWYRKSAELGNPVGADNLASFYLVGLEVEEDHAKAFQLYRESAELGFADAQVNVAKLYRSGSGTIKNNQLAFFWAGRAARQGDDNGLNTLALYYEKGIGTKKNDVKAMNFYGIAAEHGDADAQYHVGLLYETLPQLKDDKAAFTWYEKAALQNSIDAQLRLATFYLEGRGVARNVEKAKEWVTKAAEIDAGLASGLKSEIGLYADAALTKPAGAAPARAHCFWAVDDYGNEQYQEALPELSKCIEIVPTPEQKMRFLSMRANANEELHNYRAALEDQKKMIALKKPDTQWPFLMLAVYQRDLKQYNDSLASIEQARAISKEQGQEPGMPYGYHKGMTLQEMGRHEDAIAVFTAAIPSQPGYSEVYFRRSISYEALGDQIHAKEDMDKAYHLIDGDYATQETVARYKQYGYTVSLKDH